MEESSHDLDRELWCPNCGSHEYTPVSGGEIGFSTMEVVCGGCGHRYTFATNLAAAMARDEWEARHG